MMRTFHGSRERKCAFGEAHILVLVLAVDREGIITALGDFGRDVFALPRTPKARESAFELFRDSPEIVPHLRRCLEGDDFVRTLGIDNRKLRAHFMPLRAADGAVYGALLVMAEDALGSGLEPDWEPRTGLRLQGSESDLRVAGVAHDVNNLLTVVLGHTLAARRTPKLSSELVARLEAVYFAADHAAALMRSLATPRAVYGGVPHLDVSQALSELAPILRPLVAEDVLLHIEPPRDLPALEMDPVEFKRVVVNLVVNAGEAIQGRIGTVSVRVRAVKIGEANVPEVHGSEQLAPGDYVAVEVEDTGFGMEPETRERIFSPGFTTKAEGRGLGLVTVQDIVSAQGGGIQIQSEPGKGTTFRVFFRV